MPTGGESSSGPDFRLRPRRSARPGGDAGALCAGSFGVAPGVAVDRAARPDSSETVVTRLEAVVAVENEDRSANMVGGGTVQYFEKAL